MLNKSLSILILCGGSGTRLFPLSRNELPKQFLPLTNKEKTMFEITLERAKKIKYNHLFIICNEYKLTFCVTCHMSTDRTCIKSITFCISKLVFECVL